MDVTDYARECEKTWLRTRHETYEDRISYLLISLTGELGELMNKWKKVLRKDPHANLHWDDDKFLELGDIFWYLTVLCCELRNKLKYHPEDVALVLHRNLSKLESRRLRNMIEGEGDNR